MSALNKKRPCREKSLQGLFYNFICLLCYKAVCLFTQKLFRGNPILHFGGNEILKSTENRYFPHSLENSQKIGISRYFTRFIRKKRPRREKSLQGQFYNFICLLCYKAVCLFTKDYYFLGFLMLACAADKRAMGTRKGEQDT